MLRAVALLAALCISGCGATTGWDPLSVTPDPLELPDGMDERDAHAYYAYGKRILERAPARAADAFYWASRLDPAWADPIYARRMALFMARPETFKSYLAGSRRVVTAPGVLRLDSLFLRALTLNPFLQRREDATAVRYIIVRDVMSDAAYGNVSRDEVEMAVDSWLARSDVRTRAWLAHSEGRLGDAVGYYERALRGKSDPELHADLARTYVLMARFPEARAQMTTAIDRLRERDDEELVRLYSSKALFEYSLGLITEELDDLEGARAAYARALQEDLSYHPAHMRLGELALASGDTLTALSEMALAADISGASPGVRLRYGRVLAEAGQHDEAVIQLRRAIELEPLFALPHLELARTLERAGRLDEALEEYRAFMRKAARTAAGLPEARQKVGASSAGAGSGR